MPTKPLSDFDIIIVCSLSYKTILKSCQEQHVAKEFSGLTKNIFFPLEKKVKLVTN